MSYSKGVHHEIQPNLGFQRVLQRAIMQVQADGKVGNWCKLALFNEQDSQAIDGEKLTRIDVLNHISTKFLMKTKEK